MMVVGVVGQIGAGKDEMASYLQAEYSAAVVSAGEVIREAVAREGEFVSREDLHRVTKDLMQANGEDYVARRAIERIEQIDHQATKLVALNGLRTPAEVRTLRDKFGSNFVLVHADVTHPLARMERLQERNEPTDPDDMDELLQQDRKEDKLFNLSETLQMADVRVNNDGTLGAFHESIERKFAGPYLRNEESPLP
ncbi:dephospho-CoA kinase [candidate division GN15 bacterium]|nr:dephospho-CoA kinase [candidate division GN15 bacterium]